jgi:hypothetical protein
VRFSYKFEEAVVPHLLKPDGQTVLQDAADEVRPAEGRVPQAVDASPHRRSVTFGCFRVLVDPAPLGVPLCAMAPGDVNKGQPTAALYQYDPQTAQKSCSERFGFLADGEFGDRSCGCG